MFAQKLKKLNYNTELDSLKIKIKEITNWAALHNIKINITVKKLNRNLDWVIQLFPLAYEEQEKFLRETNPLDIHRRFVIYHSLLELCYNRLNHRKKFFEKLIYGKSEGWPECATTNKSFDPDKLQETNISYYSSFSNREFEAYGI